MRFKYNRIIDERIETRARVIELLAEYSVTLRGKLGKITLILYGSYARGDFNKWSDIDVIIISDAFTGVRFLDRWDLIPEPPQGLEGLSVIPWSPEEARVMVMKPAWKAALNDSIIVADDYNIMKHV